MQGWVYFIQNKTNNFKTVSEEAHGQVGNNRGEPRKVDKVHTIKTFSICYEGDFNKKVSWQDHDIL